MNKTTQFPSNYRVAILAWLLIIVLIEAELDFGVDESVVALAALAVGILGQAFAALIARIGFLPHVGPIVTHFLLHHSAGFSMESAISFPCIADRRGYVKDVLHY